VYLKRRNTTGKQISKTYSISLAIWEIQFKIIVRYHFIPVRTVIQNQNNKCWWIERNIFGGNVNYYSSYGEESGYSEEKKPINSSTI
jgi:hypothetical protein